MFDIREMCRHSDFDGWAFHLSSGTAVCDRWKLIPDGIDVLVTHGPPKGRLFHLCQSELFGSVCGGLLMAVSDTMGHG